MVRSIFIAILSCLFAFAASAQDPVAAKRRVLSIDEQPAWGGVGRLNWGAGGYCSGALIRADTVLTAAHCVIDERTNRKIPPQQLRFVAGLRQGYHTANRRAAATAVHPDWAGYRGDGQVIVRGDIAIVKLESPISGSEARTFPIGTPPQEGDDVTLVSYGRGRSTALSIQEPCQVISLRQRSATLNCDSVSGTSGSPVFRNGRIVGVISASDRGSGPDRRSYAVLVDQAVQALINIRAEDAPDDDSEAATSKPAPRARSLFKKASPGGGSRLPGGKTAPKN